jgi:hypothetical protein
MFCSFARQAKILRIYGRGRVVLPGGPDWPELARHFSASAGEGAGRRDRRAIIVVEVDRIADSCGYAVPLMELTSERDLLARNAERQSLEELTAYRAEYNAASIDGLPALSADGA